MCCEVVLYLVDNLNVYISHFLGNLSSQLSLALKLCISLDLFLEGLSLFVSILALLPYSFKCFE